MTEILRLGLVLMVVAVIAAGSLGLVNSFTEPVIREQRIRAREEAMADVAVSIAGDGVPVVFDSLSVPGLANPYAQADATLEVVGVYSEGHRRGYLFIAFGRGYSSIMQTMVACDMSGRITGMRMLFQQETPGLGANISDPDRFLSGLRGRDAANLHLTQDGGDIDAITASTVTSRAALASVRLGLEAMKAADLFTEGGDSR